MSVQSPPYQPSPKVETASDAVRLLGDADYFKWAKAEADKLFTALIAKRFPQLVPPSSPATNRN